MKRRTTWTCRLVLILVTLALVVHGAFAAGGQEPASQTAAGSTGERLTIKWWGFNVGGYLPSNDSYLKKLIEERYNINIENIMVDLGNKEQVNIKLATGVDFDISTMRTDFASRHELGLIRSIPEEYIKTYAPALYEPLYAEVGEDWKLYAMIEGEIFGIPVISAGWTTPVSMALRTDWVRAIGYDPENLPDTLEGLEEMLLKFRTDDPDGNGKTDTYALDKFDNYDAYVMGAYGISDRYWYNDDEGYPVNHAIDPRFKEVLKVLRRWYESKIFDPEIVTDGRTETTAKFIAGTVAGYYGNGWAFTLGHNQSPVKKANDAGTPIDVTVVPPVAGPSGIAATVQFLPGVSTSGMIFGRNCTDEKLIRLLQIQNDMQRDMDFMKANLFGEEGYSYVIDDDGYVQTTSAYTSEYLTEAGIQRYMFYVFMPKSSMKYRMQRDRLEMFENVSVFDKVTPNNFSVHTTEAELEYGSAIQAIRDEFYWKAVTGEIDIDAEWDGYVSTWRKAGGQEVLAQKRALYESMTADR